MNILHLSDLHFGTREDAQTWAGQLAEDLSGGLNCRRLDALIVSGDVGTRAEPEEYAAAKAFLDAVCKEFGPGPEGIVLAPGNHDLNWKLAKKGYSLKDREDFEGDLSETRHVEVGDDVIRVRDNPEAYWRRFAHFNDFHKAVKGVPYPLEPGRQGVLHHFPDHNLLILGLNSCWDIDHHFTDAAAIHPHAVGFALDDLRRNAHRYGDGLKFAVWHHPLDSPSQDRITDRGFLSRLANAGVCVAFHGHVHRAEKGLFAYDVTEEDRKIHIIGAGTFGAPSDEWHPGVPLQYNFITLEGNRLTVATRCRREKNGPWEPHAIWGRGSGKDPASWYVLELPAIQARAENAAKGSGPLEDLPSDIPSVYRTHILDRCRYMDIDRLREPGSGVRMELPELFVPLYAAPPGRKDRAETLEDVGLFGDIERSVDIEDLMAECPHLLIKGQPGSGKTTLLKHATLSMLAVDEWKGLNGWLPVLVILSQLKGFQERCPGLSASRAAAEKLLEDYFKRSDNGLDLYTVKRFCEAGKAVFLLDGLDEIDRELRDLAAHSFADFRNHYPGCKIVLSGRPHGVDGAVVDRFGDRLAEIQSLNMDQVEAFVNNWFCAVSSETRDACLKTAGEMLAEMKVHPAIDELKDTPLMLTAICLLYHDGKELPGQRADLYDKFVDNLLYKRFDDPVKVRRFLSELARDMHLKEVKGIDQGPAVEVLGQVYAGDHLEHLRERFRKIEPNSGLIVLENGQYKFWHLSFQEFLTATALADRARGNMFGPIERFWDDPWYAEVVQMYVGFLSLNQMGAANEIVERVLAAEDQTPFGKWRLAAKAFENIHKDRRGGEEMVGAYGGEISPFLA